MMPGWPSVYLQKAPERLPAGPASVATVSLTGLDWVRRWAPAGRPPGAPGSSLAGSLEDGALQTPLSLHKGGAGRPGPTEDEDGRAVPSTWCALWPPGSTARAHRSRCTPGQAADPSPAVSPSRGPSAQLQAGACGHHGGPWPRPAPQSRDRTAAPLGPGEIRLSSEGTDAQETEAESPGGTDGSGPAEAVKSAVMSEDKHLSEEGAPSSGEGRSCVPGLLPGRQGGLGHPTAGRSRAGSGAGRPQPALSGCSC